MALQNMGLNDNPEVESSGTEPAWYVKWKHQVSDPAINNDSEGGSASVDYATGADSPSELASKESMGVGDGQTDPGSEYDEPERGTGKRVTASSGKKKSGILSKLPGSSKIKKRVAILLAGFVATFIGAVFAFLAFLPARVVQMVAGLEIRSSAAARNALGNESKNFLNNYFKKFVVPNLGTSSCHTTADPNCVSTIPGSGPFSRLYQGWQQRHLETQLANNYGIVFGRQGNQLYVNVDGAKAGAADIGSITSGKESIFDMLGTSAVSATEARQKIDVALKDATLWDKAYFRFKYSKLLQNKYGVKLCVIRCVIDDKFNYKLQNKVAAAKAHFLYRVISPLSDSYGLMFACLLVGNCQDLTVPQPATTEGPVARSKFEQQLQTELQSYAEDHSIDDLDALLSRVSAISKNGFLNTAFSGVVKQVLARFGEADATDKAAAEAASTEAADVAASDAIPFYGQAVLVAQIVHLADTSNEYYIKLRYAITAAAAVQTYMMYSTVASEIKSGHVDPTEVGSFTTSLSTNLSQSNNDQLDATTTPLYQYLNNGSGGSGLPTSQAYKCSDGNPVPSGQLVCPEEVLTQSNSVLSTLHTIVNSIPGLGILAGFITQANNLITANVTSLPGVNQLISAITSYATLLPKLLLKLPGVSNLADWATQQFQHLLSALISSPFTNDMNGGRTYDMMAAGADVSNNDSCQNTLGCQKLSPQQVATIQGAQLAQDKATFESEPLFARMFSTETPYSLVSRLAVAMPTNPTMAIGNFLGGLGNPLGRLAGTFGSLFASDKAFAAPAPYTNPQCNPADGANSDPFCVTQYGYPASDIPSDPENYWNTQCQSFDPNQTDYNALANEIEAKWQTSLSQDPVTGDPVATQTQPCLLIYSTLQSDGVLFDPSLAPPNSLTSQGP